jgi:hypothetical protein
MVIDAEVAFRRPLLSVLGPLRHLAAGVVTASSGTMGGTAGEDDVARNLPAMATSSAGG